MANEHNEHYGKHKPKRKSRDHLFVQIKSEAQAFQLIQRALKYRFSKNLNLSSEATQWKLSLMKPGAWMMFSDQNDHYVTGEALKKGPYRLGRALDPSVYWGVLKQLGDTQ